MAFGDIASLWLGGIVRGHPGFIIAATFQPNLYESDTQKDMGRRTEWGDPGAGVLC